MGCASVTDKMVPEPHSVVGFLFMRMGRRLGGRWEVRIEISDATTGLERRID